MPLANLISDTLLPLIKSEASNNTSPSLIEVVLKSLLSYFTDILGFVAFSPLPILKV